MSKTYSKTRTLVECALMIALGTVLANIKIFEMPNGGSITLLSMLPFILVSYRHGTKWGLFTGFVNSLLQMLLGFYAPPAPGLLPLVGMILLDYVLAFTLLGLAGAIAKPFKNRLVGVAVGTAAVCGIRFLCSFLSGIVTVIDQRNIACKTQQCPDLFFGHGCAGATNCIRNFSLYKCQYIELSFYPVHFIFPGDSSSGLVKAEYD